MKPIKLTRQFELNYKARIAKDDKLKRAYKEGVETFRHDKTAVGDHTLRAKMSKYRAFWINGDYRVVYLETPDFYVFTDVGTHDEVYYR